jgi:hypothetical protein
MIIGIFLAASVGGTVATSIGLSKVRRREDEKKA